LWGCKCINDSLSDTAVAMDRELQSKGLNLSDDIVQKEPLDAWTTNKCEDYIWQKSIKHVNIYKQRSTSMQLW
jgi:3'-phosphoadenosine 5'-phosphosulfate sulfotransferase (PAPS reductase)/FAD synthetase